MKYVSTNHRANSVSVIDAVLQGLAPDGGLYLPQSIPTLSADFLRNISYLSLPEIAFEISKMFFEPDVPAQVLRDICAATFSFDVPLVKLQEQLFVLELFHGPTGAFKDFGARFLARLFSYFLRETSTKLTVLVATSGDTGSAVAAGFFRVPYIEVVILYPRGLISKLQERHLTTYGENVTAIDIEGTFDDCQRLVKQAFLDEQLRSVRSLASANSINIARLIPQVFYYFHAYAELKRWGFGEVINPVFSVPSGNLGNLTAGVIAKKMGFPIAKLVAAVNANDVFPTYLHTGMFTPHTPIHTISNAMDVGNPSNFARMLALYANDCEQMKKEIFSESFSDEEVRAAMKEAFQKYRYIFDPHSAVGYLGRQRFLERNSLGKENFCSVILATAHPGKFPDTVEQSTEQAVPLPSELGACMNKVARSIVLSNRYEDLKLFLQKNG